MYPASYPHTPLCVSCLAPYTLSLGVSPAPNALHDWLFFSRVKEKRQRLFYDPNPFHGDPLGALWGNRSFSLSSRSLFLSLVWCWAICYIICPNWRQKQAETRKTNPKSVRLAPWETGCELAMWGQKTYLFGSQISNYRTWCKNHTLGGMSKFLNARKSD